jgi:hypothetical protein
MVLRQCGVPMSVETRGHGALGFCNDWDGKEHEENSVSITVRGEEVGEKCYGDDRIENLGETGVRNIQ